MMKPHPQSALAQCRDAGFSLVEVAIALGIVSVGLLALLGVLPIGLIAAREANLQTARSHIIAQISGELGLLPGQELTTYIAAPQYFDENGRRLADDTGAVFTAELAAALPRYPGSTRLGNDVKGREIEVRIRHPWERPAPGSDTPAGFRTSLSFFDSSPRHSSPQP